MGPASNISLLSQPLYSVGEAARLLEVPTQKLRRWLDGFTVGDRTYQPVIRPERTGADEVTWAEFVEAGLLREYRAKLPLQRLRPLIDEMRSTFGVPYPLAHFQPLVDPKKRELVLKLQERVQQGVGLEAELLLVHRGKGEWQVQWAEPVRAFLEKVEFDPDGVAERMRPLGAESPILIDPRLSFGIPQVGGVRTELLAESYASGEGFDAIAGSWGLEITDIEAAVRWELRIKRAS
ncbi:MAG: DUF433 domain-containing protein [Actinomycetota bacterium]|nr:DUF433 domain-containing protein [Actinomycetota bacterium]